MKVIKEKLLSYLERKGLTAECFARAIGVGVSEIEKLLNGEAVDEPTARKFIYYLGADEAQHFIDWVAINKINPLACEGGEKRSDDDENDGI